MEKLIKLLDEFDHKKTEDLERWKQRVENQKLWIISKQFWFIEWLVNNNKIDFYKLEKIWYEKIIYWYDWQYREIVEYSDYKRLLMLLSISDTHIDDLISYIK